MMHSSIIEGYISRHEKVLQDLIHQQDIPAPILKEAMHYCVFSGGKRLRPILVYLTGEITHARMDCLDIIAAAIEMVHCYSLVQDDLPAMDDDDYRRGQLTCHRAYSESTAILVSDGMHGLAYDLLLSHLPQFLPDRQVIEIAQVLLRSSGFSGMVSGQGLDMSELSRPDLTTDRLCYIHQLKTGALFSACINMALRSGQSSETTTSLLNQYVNHLGIAFQMQDDFMDRYSNHLSGKKRASDDANQKTTFASLLDKTELLMVINRHYQSAYLALEQLDGNGKTLLEFTRYLHQRTP